MKELLLIAFVVWVLAESSNISLDESKAWEDFKAKYKKHYASPEEEMKRKTIFMENWRWTNNMNAKFDRGEISFGVGINEYSDLTEDEEMKLPIFQNCIHRDETNYMDEKWPDLPDIELPASVDWRKKGAVTSVKSQGDCGSCWAFSATGALEGQKFIKSGILTSMSEQNLIDCSFKEGNKGCKSGLPSRAFQYVEDNHGIDTEASYPYKDKVQNQCYYNKKTSAANVTNFHQIPQGDERKLQQAVAQIGPISVLIDANHTIFDKYTHGVLDIPDCRQDFPSHAVLVVGYGSGVFNGTLKEYYIVKNSWGTNYGLKGYWLMSRNKNNQCGIASYATFPVVS